MRLVLQGLFLFLCQVCSASVHSAEWSSNEIHVTHGNLVNPFDENFSSHKTTIVTYQHVSGWKYGDNFIMVDYIDDENLDGFNDDDFYMESYFNFSSKKILGVDYGDGLINDIGLFMGVNVLGSAKVKKFLPGVRVAWNLPGFTFLNTDFGGYVDANPGLGKGGAPKEENSLYFDVSWAYPFKIGNQYFSLEGHAEYITGRSVEELPGSAKDWMLIQPQLRWDAGNALFGTKDTFYLGFEFQYWKNKLGADVNERVAQLLAVWRI